MHVTIYGESSAERTHKPPHTTYVHMHIETYIQTYICVLSV